MESLKAATHIACVIAQFCLRAIAVVLVAIATILRATSGRN